MVQVWLFFAMFFNMKTQCRKNKKFTLASKFLFDVLQAHTYLNFRDFPILQRRNFKTKSLNFGIAYFVFSSVHKVCMHMFYFFKGKVTASKRQFYIKSSCKWHISGHCIGQSNKIQVNKLDSICQFRAYWLHFTKNRCINQAFLFDTISHNFQRTST